MVRRVLDVKRKTLVMNVNTVTKTKASAKVKEIVVPAIAMAQKHALTASNAIRTAPVLLPLAIALSVATLVWSVAVE